MTEALKDGRQNIILCGSIKANDRFGGRVDARPDSVGVVLAVLQSRHEMVDCARETRFLIAKRVVFGFCRIELRIVRACDFTSCGV